MISASAAQATYGYENTISDCSAHEAYTETTGSTLEIYAEPVAATPTTITMQFVPSFDDSNCTVKLPMGYSNFEGVTVNMTEDIQTSVGSEEVQLVLNDDGSGELQYTFTGLTPATEYQFRVDGIFTTSSDEAYPSVTDNEYYATSVAPVTGLSIATDGTVSWTNPEADDSSVKIDLSFFEVSGDTMETSTSTTKYASSGDSWEYYDFRNKFYNGNFVLIATASTKKIYDLVDHRLWGTPVVLTFTTEKGEVVKSSAVGADDSDLTDCVGGSEGDTCSVDSNQLEPTKSKVKKASKKLVSWNTVSGASYYKVFVKNKKGKKIITYSNVAKTKLSFTKKDKKKLKKSGLKATVLSCNAFGCSKAATKKLK
ncbi:MAG: hypothetical protein COW24_04990 [Candidatus Kerfeldbacteria bacterium CG15_BIG_FIL_POST_REV_8_21_14_020_45_12]|uniref:Uncharacterized protein n=1 Tax=Candidatus Kerfeldbacteria bacterium CG15_BIG_FIL_POST_REV_8_21_14_020_45_12 TaxID=2014247 RepID=A0A2M7H2R9_9BACT|nr:MAG: hypothetical protein COW24_04990 [Candidatus Kerfeldbacteria bacterium CG15_BIG_FIL_POST_REV_8_21_14_020_45_12]PJA93230.1 MAG: hypothetical protein CO132_03925 [Candidatus Kerfeldbacteria bacterium CG_4_9_14_3_um_filter_45_8]